MSAPGIQIPWNQPPQAPGHSARALWAAGDVRSRQIADVMAADVPWRVSVVGAVSLAVTYGNEVNRTVIDVRAPFEACVPGACNIVATPTNPDAETVAVVTIIRSSADGRQFVRSIYGAGALPASVGRVFAVGAATLTVDGNALALASGEWAPIVEPSVVTAGVVIAEHVL